MNLHLRHFWRAAALLATLILSAQSGLATPSQKIASLNLDKILVGKQACTTAGSSQFVSENTLLLLVGPDSDCYRNVRDLELVVVSIDGHLLARKPWPSTFPSAILSGGRIVVAEPNSLLVLNSHLQTIQTVDLPSSSKNTTVFLRRVGTNQLAVRDPRGPIYIYGGDPLRFIQDEPKDVSSLFRSFALEDGQTITLSSKSLVDADASNHDREIATLSWVNPCDKFCQEWDAGLDFSVAVEGTKRILVVSNGSRFPVTDAAGLFPYFRVEVFNLENGTSVYREQFVTKTGRRTAAISPAGNLLALNDGSHIEFRQFN